MDQVIKDIINKKINPPDYLRRHDINETDSHGNTLLHVVTVTDFKPGQLGPLLDGILVRRPDLELTNQDGFTALQLAIIHHRISIVKAILDMKKNKKIDITINQRSANGETILEILMKNYDKDIYELFIQKDEDGVLLNNYDIDINLQNAGGDGPLHLAVRYLPEKFSELLLNGADINLQNEHGNTPLHIAVLHNPSEIHNLCLYHRADVSVVNNDRNTPLHLALLNNLPEQYYTSFMVSTALTIRNSDGFTPLHLAVMKGNHSILGQLLDRAKNMDGTYTGDVRTYDGEYSKELAYRLRNRAILNLLNQRPGIKGRKLSLSVPLSETTGELEEDFMEETNWKRVIKLTEAVMEGNVEKLSKLLKQKDFLSKVDLPNLMENGVLLLHAAVKMGNIEIVRLLLDNMDKTQRYTYMNETMNYGYTLLHVSILNGRPDISHLLLERLSDPLVPDQEGHTPLELAVRAKNADAAHQLLVTNAVISENATWDMLFQLAMNNNSTLLFNRVIPHIDDGNPILHIINDDGDTPLNVASLNNNTEMVKKLITKGATPNEKSLICNNCKQKVEKTRACTNCFIPRYCTKKCQEAHWWSHHKPVCPHWKRLREGYKKTSLPKPVVPSTSFPPVVPSTFSPPVVPSTFSPPVVPSTVQPDGDEQRRNQIIAAIDVRLLRLQEAISEITEDLDGPLKRMIVSLKTFVLKYPELKGFYETKISEMLDMTISITIDLKKFISSAKRLVAQLTAIKNELTISDIEHIDPIIEKLQSLSPEIRDLDREHTSSYEKYQDHLMRVEKVIRCYNLSSTLIEKKNEIREQLSKKSTSEKVKKVGKILTQLDDLQAQIGSAVNAVDPETSTEDLTALIASTTATLSDIDKKIAELKTLKGGKTNKRKRTILKRKFTKRNK